MHRKSKRIISFLGALLMALSSTSDGGSFAVGYRTPANESYVLMEDEKIVMTEDKMEYISQSQLQGIQAKAYAKEGVLPEDIIFKVEMKEEDSLKYQEAAQELEKNGIEYEGFMTLDIGFYDATGNEVEPEKGSVEVELKLDSNLLAEDIPQETLAIQHHGKTDAGIVLETVANAVDSETATGEVTIENEILKAEFTVESFSTFTITWGNAGGNNTRTATIHYVNRDGTPIQGPQTSDIFMGSASTTDVTLRTYAGEIAGHRYGGAYLNSASGIEILRLRRSSNASSAQLQYSTAASGSSWTQIANGSNIYLVYDEDFGIDSSRFSIIGGTQTVTIYYVDTLGNSLPATQTSNVAFSSISTGGVALSTYAGSIPDYVYHGAYLGSIDGTQIQRLRRNGSNLQSSTAASGTTGFTTVTNNAEIYLVYEDAALAESRFTITGGTGSVTIYYVDQNGMPLPATQTSNVSLSNNEVVAPATAYAGPISGYTYSGAYLNNTSGTEILRLRRSSNNIQYSASASGTSWTTINGSNIYLVYQRESDASEGSLEGVRETRREKYVEQQADGTFDLNLTISGASGSLHEPAALDVIFVLDVSGSMAWNMNSNSGSNNQRRNAAGQAIAGFTNSITARGEIDPRFSLITFSGSTSGTWNDANTLMSWTRNANIINQEAANVLPDGGTNYQAGIMEAQNVLLTARENAAKAVVFISDGDPTFFYNANGTTGGSGSGFNQQALDQGRLAASGLEVDYFFTVGVGRPSDYVRLQQLNSAVNTTPPFGVNGSVANDYFEGATDAALTEAFDSIFANITSMLCNNVTITDILSENVYLTDPTELRITILDEMNNEVASGINTLTYNGETITAAYNPLTREAQLNFPPTYYLQSNHTYKITMNINASDKAYESFWSAGHQYTDQGELGTGTDSAGEEGFRTNVQATAVYTFNDETITSIYPHPVIQLNAGTLVIRKKIVGLSPAEITLLGEQLKFEYEFGSASYADGEVLLGDFEPPEIGEDYYTYTIENLPPGTTYEVIERDANLAGYTVVTEAISAQGTIVGGAASVATFVNTYTQSTMDLEVTKKDKHGAILEGATFKLEGATLDTPIILEGTAGIFLFAGLLPGIYTLTETKAPDNYTLLANPITMIITAEGAVTIDGVLYSIDIDRIIRLDVINNEIYELPSVGGIGTYLFTISGVAIATTAILLFINERRREGRQ